MSDNKNRSAPYIGDAAVKPPVPVAIRRVLFAVAILSDLAAVAVGLLMQEEAMLFTLFLLGFGQIFLSSYITMRTKRARCTKYVAGQVSGTVSHPKMGVFPIISYVIDGETYRVRGTWDGRATSSGRRSGSTSTPMIPRGYPRVTPRRSRVRHRGRDRVGNRGAVPHRSSPELYPAMSSIRERT